MEDKRYIAIGENIRRLRKMQYLSQEKLAELLNISPNHLHRIETAKSRISLSLLLKIAEVFNTNVHEIIKEEQGGRIEVLEEIEEILEKSNDIEKEIIRQTIYNLYHTLKNVRV